MAKFDIRRHAVTYQAGVDNPTVTFSSPAAELDLIVVGYAIYLANLVTPPAGFTPIYNYADGDSQYFWFAKIATGFEPTSYTALFDTARNTGGVGYIVEGPFTGLSGITVGTREGVPSFDTFDIPNAPTSIGSAGLAIAMFSVSYGGFTPATVNTWSNSFVDRGIAGGSGAHLYTATRTYTGASSVQTTVNTTNTVFAAKTMITITDSGGGGGGGGGTPAGTLVQYRQTNLLMVQ